MLGDNRRFKFSPPPTGKAKALHPDHVAMRNMRTRYPATVKTPKTGHQVLKSGFHNRKIGGKVQWGSLKGAKIFTLTLEERATCPVTCPLLAECYGNQMGQSDRFEWCAETRDAIRHQVANLCRGGKKVLLRLHVLGDFKDAEAVQFWGRVLSENPGLNIFGWTAHNHRSDIGRAIKAARRKFTGRFQIRFSHKRGKMGTRVIKRVTHERFIGNAVVCPQQLDALNGSKRQTHCGSCCVCWETGREIIFMEH